MGVVATRFVVGVKDLGGENNRLVSNLSEALGVQLVTGRDVSKQIEGFEKFTFSALVFQFGQFFDDQLSHLAMSFAFNQKDRPPGIPEVYLPQKTHGNYFSGLSAMHAGYWIKYTELRRLPSQCCICRRPEGIAKAQADMIWYQLSNFQRYYRQEIHCVTVVSDLDKEKTISIGSQERRKVNNQGLCFVLTRAVASCRPRVHATGIFFPMHALFFVCFFQSIFLGCVCVIFFIIIFTRLTRPEFAPSFFYITRSMNQTCSRNRSVFVLRSILSSVMTLN